MGATRASQVAVWGGDGEVGLGFSPCSWPHLGKEFDACRASRVPAELYGKISHAGVALWWNYTFPFVFQAHKRTDFLWLTDESSMTLVQDKRSQREILCKTQGWHWNLNLDITQPLLPPPNSSPKPPTLQSAFQALLAFSPQPASCDTLQK